ncbi:GNAT family N-acetyltransferase [Paenibacillus odorifer]|jgi:RimJ/RimL family protein N-acetyltransferase|uniref:GNAT family N-acetyltransferase n=2 Tax=Paenibacillus TaxID=44249 RepID=UPI00096D585C|nr:MULTISPECIES: GNAT family N-acetyltransferase [unclassified Paenibacillus]MDH6427303.1 RimJ/RimL family protein N-acetyltransferase [Paenibacillus sp. PastH-4]MDH6443333.1 RimJ/RimL family protein N-acetyltransferase [Paenibacillus sp. PastF-4]MDH6525963.1 RimJ/RimL family protein N-acetyltransferase [Paenibacillus sp. PastH-3]OMD66396.1 GNAT family N-acetyltransferase [Paenibacillus odorifer]
MSVMNTVILDGKSIKLVPTDESHAEGLAKVLRNPDIWEFTWRKITSDEQVQGLISTALANQKNGSQITFTIIDKATERIIGTTRIMHPDLVHRNAEIGCTWISPDYWRTSVNTEGKSLLLHYCFEELKLIRVEFAVVANNLRSQRAVERIGAVKEGVLRKHRIKSDGSIHDNVVFSILDTEWPAVKENLHYLINDKYA